jgi:hypothetical protein
MIPYQLERQNIELLDVEQPTVCRMTEYRPLLPNIQMHGQIYHVKVIYLPVDVE